MTQATETQRRSASAGVRAKTVAVVGATGAVGAEMLRCLEKSTYPTGTLKLFASERSVGKRLAFRNGEVEMRACWTSDSFDGVDVALFASETDISKKFVPIAAQAGAVAIDNSSAFRMDPNVPLVVPEVNGAPDHEGPEDLRQPELHGGDHGDGAVAAAPGVQAEARDRLDLPGGLRRGPAGDGRARGLDPRLPHRREVRAESPAASLRVQRVQPQHDDRRRTATTARRQKVVKELRKIMGLPDLRVGVTCVRVPVLRAHCDGDHGGVRRQGSRSRRRANSSRARRA